jgi:hypothetical protein
MRNKWFDGAGFINLGIEPNTSMGDQMMTETETSEWLLVATQQPTHKPAGGPI